MLNGQVKSVMKNSLVKFSKELKVSWNDEIFEGFERLQECDEKWESV
jgi:hypothetical protein